MFNNLSFSHPVPLLNRRRVTEVNRVEKFNSWHRYFVTGVSPVCTSGTGLRPANNILNWVNL